MTDAITQFESGGHTLRQAIAGLTPADLVAFPVPGTWSIQQLVIHLADSDAIGVHRMKRIITEDNPLLIGYDESRFVQNLFYDDQSAEAAVDLFDLNRREFAKVLRRLPPAAFARFGTHNELGRVTLAQYVPHYTEHLDHHLRFLYDKRKALGKPHA